MLVQLYIQLTGLVWWSIVIKLFLERVRVVFLHLSAPTLISQISGWLVYQGQTWDILQGIPTQSIISYIFADLPFDLIAQNLRCMYTLNFHFGAKMYTRKQALVTSYTITVQFILWLTFFSTRTIWAIRQDFRWISTGKREYLWWIVKTKVSYEVRNTSLGKGVFVLEDVKQGTLVWR